jgi:hypothetical protein
MKILLILLVGVIAVAAIASGISMINSPDGVTINLQTYLLDNTPFKNFLIPGILLTFFVGGVNLVAFFINIFKKQNRFSWAIAGGIVITGWVITEMVLTGFVHGLHFIYLAMGVVVILISYQLKGKWIV